MKQKIDSNTTNKTVYISSYYQSKEWAQKFEMSFDSDTKRVKEELNQMKIIIGDVLQVSQENYDKLSSIRPSYNTSSDYIVSLQCDIEVAIQEKKLTLLAEKFGFRLIDETTYKPKMVYVEEFSIDDVVLAEDEIIKGNLYVINTHGKEQSIDGPYYQSLSKNDLQRILVDACSSANRGFPVKNSGNKSVVEMIADECIKDKKGNLEIVGYQSRFDTTKSQTSACAAFANAEKIAKDFEYELKLITLADREEQLAQIHQQDQIKAQQAKLKNFKRETANCSPEEALKKSLIDVSSKLFAEIIYNQIQPKNVLNTIIKERVIQYISDMTMSNHTLDLIHNVNRKNYKNTLAQLKKEKKELINSSGYEKMLEFAKMTHEIGKIYPFKSSDKNFLSSLLVLESLIKVIDPKIPEDKDLERLDSQKSGGTPNNYAPAFFHPENGYNANIQREEKHIESSCTGSPGFQPSAF